MKNVYFIGIGGIGMSALARYFAFKGYNVSGYDKTPSELTAELIKEGIGVHYEDDITAIPKDVEETLVVYTPAIPEDLGELVGKPPLPLSPPISSPRAESAARPFSAEFPAITGQICW